MCCILVKYIYDCFITEPDSDDDVYNHTPITQLTPLPIIKINTPTSNFSDDTDESTIDDTAIDDTDEHFIEVNGPNILTYYQRRTKMVSDAEKNDSLPNCSSNDKMNFLQKYFYSNNISHLHSN